MKYLTLSNVGGNVKNKLDLSNYASKSDVKNRHFPKSLNQ